jgi:hypothetical protein
MASESSGASSLPATLMQGVEWLFRGSPFADQKAFNAAVTEFQNPEWGPVWHPDEVVLRAARIRVVPDVDWYVGDEDPVAELSADDGQAFTAGELLFKVHNAFVAGMQQSSHQFFEGFSRSAQQVAGEPPRYDLELGS